MKGELDMSSEEDLVREQERGCCVDDGDWNKPGHMIQIVILSYVHHGQVTI